MKEAQRQPPHLRSQLEIDAVCQAFEDHWIAGEAPAFRSYLLRIDESLRQRLLPELLGIELHYRSRAGQHRTASDYLSQVADLGPGLRDILSGFRSNQLDTPPRNDAESSAAAVSLPRASPTSASPDAPNKVDLPDSIPASIAGYKILREVGRGGMGVVYAARTPADDQVVAIKRLCPSAAVNAKSLQLFLRETSMLARLRHPRIVSMLESGLVDGKPYFVMEYVSNFDYVNWLHGQTNEKRIRTAVAIICRVLEGLAYAHQQGIVHRDVKPSNILAERRGKSFAVKLADFGLAKEFQDAGLSTLTAEGEIRGTLQYMPPEQLRNAKLSTPACDVYSSIACLYFFITGELPIELPNDFRALAALLREKPAPIGNKADYLPKPLCKIIDGVLMSEPARRPSCEETRKLLSPYSMK